MKGVRITSGDNRRGTIWYNAHVGGFFPLVAEARSAENKDELHYVVDITSLNIGKAKHGIVLAAHAEVVELAEC